MSAGDVVRYSDPNHQPIVPKAAGVPPYCTCGVVGGLGIPEGEFKVGAVTIPARNRSEYERRPLLAHHLRDVGSFPISHSASTTSFKE